MTQVEIESILQHEDIQALLENAEADRLGSATGAGRADRAAPARRARNRRALQRARAAWDRDRRGAGEGEGKGACSSPAPDLVRDDDRRAAAVPARGRPARAADRRAGGRAREADRARRHGREDAHDPVEPPARRLDREELPQPGPAVPRPDPGGDARPDPRRREVRLAPRLQVLDVRDLVDPPGRRARARRQGAHDPACRSTSSSGCRR